MSMSKIRLRTAEGVERLVELPSRWLNEALEHTAPDREYRSPQIVFRQRGDDLIVSDENGAELVLTGANRPGVLARIKHEMALDAYDGDTCPACGSDAIEGRGFDTESSDTISQQVDCNACSASWIEIYTLSGYTDLQVVAPSPPTVRQPEEPA
jgi:hypothetical protein